MRKFDTHSDESPQRYGLPRWAQDVLEGLPPLLSRDLAARTAGISKKSIDRRVREGLLQAVRCGGRVLIPRLALMEFLAGGTR
jgi:excisionase family DNA binding protein